MLIIRVSKSVWMTDTTKIDDGTVLVPFNECAHVEMPKGAKWGEPYCNVVVFTHYLIEIRLTAQQIELMPVLVLGKSDHNCDLYPVNSFTFMYFTVCLVKVLPRWFIAIECLWFVNSTISTTRLLVGGSILIQSSIKCDVGRMALIYILLSNGGPWWTCILHVQFLLVLSSRHTPTRQLIY